MIEHAEHVAGTGAHQRMVERGADVDENKRTCEDGATDDDRRRPAGTDDDQISRTGHGEHGAHTMRNGICKNVAQPIRGEHKSIIETLSARSLDFAREVATNSLQVSYIVKGKIGPVKRGCVYRIPRSVRALTV